MIKSRRMRWVRHVACMEEMRNAYKILVGKSKGVRPLGRPRCRLEDIKMDFREMGLEGVNCIHLAQDMNQWWAPVNMEMNLRVPYRQILLY
jgi:hypothetical protein